MEGLSVPVLFDSIVDGSNNSNVEEGWADSDQEGLPDEEGSDGASDEMELSPEEEREIEEIMQRQSKRARGEVLHGDKANQTPPHPRAARRPREKTPSPDDEELPLHSLG